MGKLKPGEAISWVIVCGGFSAVNLDFRAKSVLSCYWRAEGQCGKRLVLRVVLSGGGITFRS
ncbi:hypothetical protein LEMLEM_LOCUS24286 [Lemmus lemmus]